MILLHASQLVTTEVRDMQQSTTAASRQQGAALPVSRFLIVSAGYMRHHRERRRPTTCAYGGCLKSGQYSLCLYSSPHMHTRRCRRCPPVAAKRLMARLVMPWMFHVALSVALGAPLSGPLSSFACRLSLLPSH